MHTLAKLFNSEARVKLLRLFLQNPDIVFLPKEVARRSRVSIPSVNRELRLLSGIGMIGKHYGMTFDTSSKAVVPKKISGWGLEKDFAYTTALQGLLVPREPFSDKEVLSCFRNAGRLSLLVVSGVFINEPHSRADILLVGDRLKRGAVERGVKNIEALLGRELSYAILDTKEFEYRYGVYDKFVRDILDYSHRKIVNKLKF